MLDLVTSIATSLAQYGTSIGVNESLSFYERLSWGGLESTTQFSIWAESNNLNFSINQDGTTGGQYGILKTALKQLGNSQCNE